MYEELMCSVERGFNLLLGGCALEREDVANPYFSCCCFARSKVTLMGSNPFASYLL